MVGVVNFGRISQQYMDRKLFEYSFRVDCKVRVSAANIFRGLEELVHPNDIFEISRTDSLMWNVVIASEAAAGILRDCGEINVGGRPTKLVSISHQVVEVRCHWLPAFIKDEFLKFVFSDYGRVQEIKRETTVLGAGLERQNGVRVVVLETDDVIKGNIPHLMRFDGNMSMLITMPGRPPLCLRCQNVGHVRRDCNTMMQPRQPRPYVKSYAAAVATIEPPSNDKEPEVETEVEIENKDDKTDDEMEDETEVNDKTVDEPVVEGEKAIVCNTTQKRQTERSKGKSETQGVRRTWDDCEGFDLLAASQGHLYIDDQAEESSTVKRSKTSSDTVDSDIG